MGAVLNVSPLSLCHLFPCLVSLHLSSPNKKKKKSLFSVSYFTNSVFISLALVQGAISLWRQDNNSWWSFGHWLQAGLTRNEPAVKAEERSNENRTVLGWEMLWWVL